MIAKKHLACAELGVPECDFQVSGSKEESLKDAIWEHTNKYHSEKLEHMSDDEKHNLERVMDEKLNRW